MRPELIKILNISSLHCLIGFLIVLAGCAVWLAVLRNKKSYSRDHLITAMVIAVMAAFFLAIISHAGEFHIYSYGAMLMLGFVVAILVSMKLAKRRGIVPERLLDLGLVILICAIIGARLQYLLFQHGPGEKFFDFNIMMSQGIGGLGFFGGLIGGVVGTVIYVRFAKLNFLRVADSCAPGIAIGYAITRIGCFLNGCCYGKHCDLPWAVTFQNPVIGAPPNVHPTQIYASLMGLAMFVILLLLSRGNSLGRSGRLLMVFLMLESVERFVMEIFRHPDANFSSFPTPAQYFCIVLLLVGIIGWFILPNKPAVDEVAIKEAKSVVAAK